jgi:hypothetical protein
LLGRRKLEREGMSADASTVSLTVPARPEYIVLTRLALSAVCRLTSLEPEEVADLKLAITEAATGVVAEDSDEQLACDFELGDDRLVLAIDGPSPEEFPAEERELGRAIIEATVDEVDYGDVIRLVKYLDAPRQ